MRPIIIALPSVASRLATAATPAKIAPQVPPLPNAAPSRMMQMLRGATVRPGMSAASFAPQTAKPAQWPSPTGKVATLSAAITAALSKSSASTPVLTDTPKLRLPAPRQDLVAQNAAKPRPATGLSKQELPKRFLATLNSRLAGGPSAPKAKVVTPEVAADPKPAPQVATPLPTSMTPSPRA